MRTDPAEEGDLLTQYRESAAQRSARITGLLRELQDARDEASELRWTIDGLKRELARSAKVEQRLRANLKSAKAAAKKPPPSSSRRLASHLCRAESQGAQFAVRAARKTRRVVRSVRRRAGLLLRTETSGKKP